MPLYEYACDDCGHRFERIRKFSDAPVTVCPACEGTVRKLVSSPAIQFKGTGWYITDYARKPSGGQAASSEKADTDGKSEGKKEGASTSKAAESSSSSGSSGSADSSKATKSSSSSS